MEAWEELVQKYYGAMYSYCVRRCYGERDTASDLTQDIFLKLVKNIQNYRFVGKFSNYIFTIAVNTCNNHDTKKKIVSIEFDENYMNVVDENSNVSLNKETNDLIVQEALNTLPTMQKEAIILKFYHELKVKEIAKITGANIATTQSRIQQGLKKLHEILSREDFENER